MGYLSSASTIYARAYLTEKGREYLFNNNNIRFDSLGRDLFKITTFTLGDPDVNYTTTVVPVTGEVPDISGKNESCLKTAVNYQQRNMLFYQNFDQIVADDVQYNSNFPNDVLDVNINTGNNNLPVGVDVASAADSGSGSNAIDPTARLTPNSNSSGNSTLRL